METLKTKTTQELLKELYTNINTKNKQLILNELEKRPKNKITYI